MKKFTKIMSAAVLAAASLSLSGCQDEDFGYTADQIAYEKLFVSAFGKIDPNHDWNLAEQGQVSVTPGSSSNIKIYAKIGEQYQLVADYADVQGTQNLKFDAIDGTKEVMVSDGHYAEVVPVGGSINFGSATRATITGTQYGVTVSNTSDYIYFTDDLAKAYNDVCPEGKNNANKVTSNFTLVSNGPFTIYPVYFKTSSNSNIGVYYRDADDNLITVDFYRMKEGDDFQYWCPTASYADGNPVPGWKDFQTFDQSADAPQASGSSTSIGGVENIKYRSKGITIDMPKGTVFGLYMYVHTNAGVEFTDASAWYNYSETALNTMDRFHGSEKLMNNADNLALAGFYTVGNCTYFSFEDWNPDQDLNDMVFMFDGSNIPTPVDNTATEWLVACEDLNVTGSFDDEDFNDIVFKVSHGQYNGSGYTTMQFTPLAAVGTYRSDIYANNGSEDVFIGEIHELVKPGTRPVSTNLYDVINGETVGDAGPSITLPCDANFSMDAYIPGNYTSSSSEYAQTKMGGFTIRSYRDATDASAEDAKVIAPNDRRGTAGAMFCIPASWTDANSIRYTWKWPKETTNIALVYPSFTSWVSDMSSNTDWYKAVPTTGKHVTGAYTIAETTTVETGEPLNSQSFIPLSSSPAKVLLNTIEGEGDQEIVVSLTSGSQGTFTIVSGTNAGSDGAFTYSENLEHGKITITAVAAGTGNIVVRQEAEGKYGVQTLTIPVEVTSGKNSYFQLVNDTDANLSYAANTKTKVVEYKTKSTGSVTATSLNTSAVTVACTQPSGDPDSDGFYTAAITLTTQTRNANAAIINVSQAETTMGGDQYSSGAFSINVTLSAFQYTKPDGYETRIEAPAGTTAGWYRVSSILELNQSDYTDGMKICVVLDEAPAESFTAWIGAGSNNKRVSATCAASTTQFEFDVTAEELGNWFNWYSGSGLDLMDIPQSCPVNSVWVKAVAGSTPGSDSQDPVPTSNDYSSLGTSVSIDQSTIQYCSLIATSDLPTSGTITITYVFSMTDNYKNFNAPYIKGKHWNDGNQYNQYWEDIPLGDVTVSDITTGNPNYVTVSITVNATAYANCTYINYGSSYTNGTLIGAYYK